MNLASTLTLVGVALYSLISFKKFGITTSISETFYKWETAKWSVMFVLFCLIVAAGAWGNILYPYDHATKWLLFWAGASMIGVGLASTYRDDSVEKIHYTLAMLAIALGFAAVMVEHWGHWQAHTALPLFVVSSVVIRRFWPRIVTTLIEEAAIVIVFTLL